MDLQLTEEQVWLGESVGELVAREASDDGFVPKDASDRLWRALVELGALQVNAAEDGLGAVELALIARALGNRLAAVPYVETAAVHYAFCRFSSLELGTASASPCLSEPGRSFAPTMPASTVEGGRLTGTHGGVAYAEAVDLLAVPATSDCELRFTLVPRTDAGVQMTPEATLDPTVRPALVQLASVSVAPDRTVTEPAATPLVTALAALGGVLCAAESVGAAYAVLTLARDYAAQRRQFGHTIGSFQAVRHLLADMYVRVESSWSSVLYAAASLDEDAPDSLRTASIAKAYSSRATLEVAHSALQVFGGVAFTSEHPAHRYLRRIVVRGSHYGTAGEHERELGRSLQSADRVSVGQPATLHVHEPEVR